MVTEHLNLNLITLLAAGFLSASIFGYIARRFNVSTIIGYLVGGFFIGPYSPFFTANIKLAESVAEIGVILMMFSVGMQFHWRDVLGAKKVTMPGGFLQTAVITIFGLLLFAAAGYSLESGLIFGICLGIASTVVLVRQLADNKLLDTTQGKLCMGWLIIEDKIAVVSLVLIPTLAEGSFGQGKLFLSALASFVFVFFKFFLLVYLLFIAGKPFARFILEKVQALRSRELFTITVLALAFMFTELANIGFGISIVIGAFLAGIVIGEVNMHDKINSHILPIKEAFIVLFFLAMGMLFDLKAVFASFPLFIATLSIILIIKPLSAYLIAKGFHRTKGEALTVAVALAQIGELSFILAEESNRYQILPDPAYDVLVACAIISIAINPFLFKRLGEVRKSGL